MVNSIYTNNRDQEIKSIQHRMCGWCSS